MSKIQIVGPSTGTGTLTLTSEATNTDQTITFPNSTATIVAVAPGTAGNVITSNGTSWVLKQFLLYQVRQVILENI